MTTQFKVCNCNRSMPLDAAAGAKLGAALGTAALPVASELCRRELGSVLQALQGMDDVVIACTQERALFAELAQAKVQPLRFVNLRESGGWSSQAQSALPKMAALLAAAALPDPDPVPTVSYRSGGHVLIIGAADRVLPWARRLGAQRDVSVLLTAGGEAEMLQDRTFPSYSGARIQIVGWLGQFKVRWQQRNPIDLQACTRCNACIDACPENAIDLTFQIDLLKCSAQRACVKACGPVAAIDFARSATERGAEFDLIFDLSDTPLIALHAPPQGYFAPGSDATQQFEDAFTLLQMVGEFEKPKFFSYKEKLCAHSRNTKIGCHACIDVCSAEAISHHGNQIQVNPHLCAGCGACTTICPSGALAYAYPRAPDMGLRLKTMLSTYASAGGQHAAMLVHSKGQGEALISQLGRLARMGGTGMPARVIPLAVQHTASVGLDLWLAAIAYGAAHVALLLTAEEAPQYVQALEQQIAIGQQILSSLGYVGMHLQLIHANNAAELEVALHALPAVQAPAPSATFNVAAEKRATLDFALSHLLKYAPAKPDLIPLPQAALYGAVSVNLEKCTLCMSCVGACPASALMDNQSLPQLRFVESNCVQCGLCQTTCPEHAISLTPRLLLTDAARQPAILNQAQPYHCIRCSKPFGTEQMIENMLGKLALHGAFAGNPERIRMCSDCRVVDMMENKSETSIFDAKRAR